MKTVQGAGTTNDYATGFTGTNGLSTGTLTFTVPVGAPNTLYYNCEFHAAMTGTINITN